MKIAPMDNEQLTRFLARLDTLLGDGKPIPPGQGIAAEIEKRIKVEGDVSAARHRLIDFGFAEERLRQFPRQQIILLDEKREYQVRRDDILKLMTLPMPQAAVLAAEIKAPAEKSLFAARLVEGLIGVYWRRGLFDQRIALLRHIEALRMYAALNQRALPAKLADVPVPLPDDPITGKPFHYQLSGTTAHIRGTAPAAEAKNPAFKIHYELTIQK